MKLVEKKCPNCGANIKFNKNDNEVTCKYCNTCFEIEKDSSDLLGEIINPEYFSLQRKMITKFSKGIIIFSIITFVVIFAIFIIMFLRIFPKI